MNDKRSYADSLRARLDRMSNDIADLEKSANGSTAAEDDIIEDKIIELRARRSLLRDKLAALESASGEAWREYKAGVEAAADSLSFALRSMRTSL